MEEPDLSMLASDKVNEQPNVKKKSSSIALPDLNEESLLHTSQMVTQQFGSEWEKVVQSTAYSPGSTVQLMRAASIKRRHLSGSDVSSPDTSVDSNSSAFSFKFYNADRTHDPYEKYGSTTLWDHRSQ